MTRLVPDGAVQLEHEVEHLAGGAAVEIAGRLVGEHAARLGDERARERDALALAAGELARQMRDALARPTRSSIACAAARAASGARRLIASGIATFSSAVNSGSRWWNW